MVEQAVHMWDVLHWIAGESPTRASGIGRRDAFARSYPRRDVTDWYTAILSWESGFSATMRHSWVDPPDDAFTGITQQVVGTAGGLDFATGTATFRDRSRPRQTFHPGKPADTRFALQAFVDAIRANEPPSPPLTLQEAREAVITGLLVRRAIDEKREVGREEIAGGSPAARISSNFDLG